MSKDLFSNQAEQYAKYRPTYPNALFEYILSFVDKKDRAWDCATGNGQAAVHLANHFKLVEATDISETQLQFATQKHNIYYQVASAEDTPFADDVFDLITVATAYHWLDWAVFKKEACRVGKNGCVIAVWCYYAMFTEDEAINQLFLHFYHDILGSYWEPERKYVDDQYCTIPFPFQPLPTTSLQIKLNWTKEQFKGYLASWSASQTYFKEKGLSPVSSIEKKLDELWNDEDTLAITFPLCLLLGKVVK